jgi:hypothetical protein
MEEEKQLAYKAFYNDWSCGVHTGKRFPYVFGRMYYHDGPVQLCESGFHACTFPLDVLRYYRPGKLPKLAMVAQWGKFSRNLREQEPDFSSLKQASEKIELTRTLTFPELIAASDAWVRRKTNEDEVNLHERARLDAALMDTGGAVSSMDELAARSQVHRGAQAIVLRGNRSAAFAGPENFMTTMVTIGDYSVSRTQGEDCVAVAQGTGSAALVESWDSVAVATNVGGVASATGNRCVSVSTHDLSLAETRGERGIAVATAGRSAACVHGELSVAVALALHINDSASHASADDGSVAVGLSRPWDSDTRVRAGAGGALVLVQFSRACDGEPNVVEHVWAGKVGENGIKPDTWYMLDENGQPVECEDDGLYD